MRNLTAILCLTVTLLLGSPGVSWSDDYQKGQTAYENGDYATALRLFKETASFKYEYDKKNAQLALGNMYHNGEGVPQDYKTALKWYRLAAEKEIKDMPRPYYTEGMPQAQFNLGYMYKNGLGVPQDYKTALKWYNLAAENEKSETTGVQWKARVAYKELTIKIQKELAAKKAKKKAAKVLKQATEAAEKGFAGHQFQLGTMYAEGKGAPQNYKTAVKWYRLAAEQGFSGAQFKLGTMYAEGQGVSQNDKTALKWYRLAAEQGDARAKKEYKELSIKIQKEFAAKKAKKAKEFAAKKAKKAKEFAVKKAYPHLHKGYEKGHAQQKFLAELIAETKSSISKNDSSVKRKYLWIKTSKKLCSSSEFDVTGIKKDWVGYVKIVRMADSGTLSLNVYIDNFDNEVADKKLSQEFLDLALELKSSTLINKGDLVKFSGYFKKGDMTENECIDGGIQGNPELTGEVFSFRFTKLEIIK